MAIALCGCGVKPDKLEAPAGAESARFPRTYPAPESPLDVQAAPHQTQQVQQTRQDVPAIIVKPTASGSRTRHVFRP